MAFLQADGPLVTAGQIYVTSLDAAPREEDIISGVASIDAGEIVADEIRTTNLFMLGELQATGDLNLSAYTNVNLATIKRLAIGEQFPGWEFSVGDNDVIIDRDLKDIVTISGNLNTTNVLAHDLIHTYNDNFIVNTKVSNIVEVTGNTVSTNIFVRDHLIAGSGDTSFKGSNVAIFRNGDVSLDHSNLHVIGDIIVAGNVSITDDLTYKNSNNLVVANAVIQMADGVPGGVYDSALIMTDYPDIRSNLVLGYSTANTEFFFSRTFESAYTIGSVDTGQTVPLDANTINVHTYGRFYTDGNVGVANISTDYTLCVGSNVYFDDTGSNVMYSRGNVYIEQLLLGDGGFSSTSDLLQINPGEVVSPIIMNSNVQTWSIRTTGQEGSGISNIQPTDTLSIGSKIIANITKANTLTVYGNTATTNLETQTIISSSNILIHGDVVGPDSISNAVIVRAGPMSDMTSSIEVFGASDSNTHQKIQFLTMNTERARFNSNGYLGISNTNPSQPLTVGGNVFVTGSNVALFGNVWGDNGMRIYSNPESGRNKIENIVNSGEGLNIYVSETEVMGSPSMTITESSNVGIGSTQPQSLFQTSGGSAFINPQVQRRNGYNHLNTPLVVNQTLESTTINQTSNVLSLTREGTGSKYGSRATFKMSKWDMTDNKSKSRLDIDLADDDYNVDTNIMTIRSDGKVGIGHTIPDAYLEVKCEGTGTPGLLVHNHDSGDAISTVKVDTNNGKAFNGFVNGSSGWSAGITGSQGDFRITNDATDVSTPSLTRLFMDSANSNVGIKTDICRDEIELHGNVVIGNTLTFGGLPGDEFGNTIITERQWTPDQYRNELLIFKGNEGAGLSGPDRIRHIAPQHIFQTYATTGQDIDEILLAKDGEYAVPGSIPLVITPGGVVVIGGYADDALNVLPGTKLVVGGNIEFTGGGSFQIEGFEFETTVQGINKIRCKLDGSTRRPLTFTHQLNSISDTEFARFDEAGRFGLGTSTMNSNIQAYASQTTDLDMLRLESPTDQVNDKKTGILIYTDYGYGGHIRSYRDFSNELTGIHIGTSTDLDEKDVLTITDSSNVGVGTGLPGDTLHVYGGNVVIEQTGTQSAIMYLNTPSYSSSIVSDSSGNLLIDAGGQSITMNDDVYINGDFILAGGLDLGNEVAIDLNGEAANTSLHCGGGLITGSNDTAVKRYSFQFLRSAGSSHDIRLKFRNGSFYAKIVAMLRRAGYVGTLSTMILEVTGGTHDESSVTYNIVYGDKNIFTNGDPSSVSWSEDVLFGKNLVSLFPADGPNGIAASSSSNSFYYDISVELVSSCNGGLEAVGTNNSTTGPDTYIDDIIPSTDYRVNY